MLRSRVPIEGRPKVARHPCRWWQRSLIFTSVLLVLAQPVAAEDKAQLRVLVLYGAITGAPGSAPLGAAYQRVLGGALGSRVDIVSEFIDFARFSDPGYPAAFGAWLRFKYTTLSLDLVIATNDLALQFVERARAELFPGIPILFVDRTGSFRPGPGMSGVRADLDLSRTLDLALALQPRTKRVYVVSGVSEFDRFYENLARQQFERFQGRLTPTYLSGQTIIELEQTLAHLPPDSVIYFLTFGQDGAGARFETIHVFDRLSAVANAPMYAWHEVGLDHGIVGGRLYNSAVVGERTAELALRILRGEKPDSIPVLDIDPYTYQLDWRQLRRWGISEARVPQGSTILFRETSLWDRYKVYIAGILALVVLQTAFITGLLVQRTRRRRVEAALRESEGRFRFMADTAPVMIWLAGSDKRYHFFNQRWLDFRGRTFEQEAGDLWTEGVHPEDSTRCRNAYTEAFDARKPFQMEYRLRRFDGEYCWVMDAGVPRVAPDGSFAGYIGSCIEITDIKRAEREMRESQATLEASNRQISDLFGRLIAAQETERTRIARDLHDNVSQRVAGLSIMISGLKRRFRGQSDEAHAVLTQIQQNTIALAEEIRHVSHDLHPSLLQHTGLVAALSVYCAQFEKVHPIAVTYSVDTDMGHVEADAALCLYRITQEALGNVAKHAGARRVNVTLTSTTDGVQLSIADDGKGFDLGEQRGKAAGLGLVSIDERVRLLRGSFHIETQPRCGTLVQVRIPRPHDMPPAHLASQSVAALLTDSR